MKNGTIYENWMGLIKTIKSSRGVLEDEDIDLLIDRLYLKISEVNDATKWRLRDDIPVVAIDFDGCISDYSDKTGSFSDIGNSKPMPGVIDWIRDAILSNKVQIAIYSCRANTTNGANAIRGWLWANQINDSLISQIKILPGKPNMHLLIDDRCLRFNGRWGTWNGDSEKILNFKPWYKKERLRDA